MDLESLLEKVPADLRQSARDYIDYSTNKLRQIARQKNKSNQIEELRRKVEPIFLLKFLHSQYVIGYENYKALQNSFTLLGIASFSIGSLQSSAQSRENPQNAQWAEIVEKINILIDELNVRQFLNSDPETIINHFADNLN